MKKIGLVLGCFFVIFVLFAINFFLQTKAPLAVEARFLLDGATLGAVLAVIAFLIHRLSSDAAARGVLAIFLMIAAGAYFGFAVLGREKQIATGGWVLAELFQAIFFGVLAIRGLRSAYCLAAGWALHPIWDYAAHFLVSRPTFVPVSYAVACISFDWIVALYIFLVERKSLDTTLK